MPKAHNALNLLFLCSQLSVRAAWLRSMIASAPVIERLSSRCQSDAAGNRAQTASHQFCLRSLMLVAERMRL